MALVAPDEPLVLSVDLGLQFDPRGRPVLTRRTFPRADVVAPAAVWTMLGVFSPRRPRRAAEAIREYCRRAGLRLTPAVHRTASRLVIDLVRFGALRRPGDERSPYGSAMAESYRRHRGMPGAVAALVARTARIGPATRVLDLATGTGSLAIALAGRARRVTALDLSRAFLAVARRDARARGVTVRFVHAAAEQLAHLRDTFDVACVASAIHWLDLMALGRGLQHALAPGGRLVLVDARLRLARGHPLRGVLGEILLRGPARARCAWLRRTYAPALALSGLRLRGAGAAVHLERREIGEGFAHAFLTPAHLAAAGADPDDVGRDIAARCRRAAPRARRGTVVWCVAVLERT